MCSLVADDVGIEFCDVFVFHVDHFFEFFNVNFIHIVATRRPLTGLQANHATHDFHQALQQQQQARNRDDGLKRVNRRAVGRDVGVLVDGP